MTNLIRSTHAFMQTGWRAPRVRATILLSIAIFAFAACDETQHEARGSVTGPSALSEENTVMQGEAVMLNSCETIRGASDIARVGWTLRDSAAGTFLAEKRYVFKEPGASHAEGCVQILPAGNLVTQNVGIVTLWVSVYDSADESGAPANVVVEVLPNTAVTDDSGDDGGAAGDPAPTPVVEPTPVATSTATTDGAPRLPVAPPTPIAPPTPTATTTAPAPTSGTQSDTPTPAPASPTATTAPQPSTVPSPTATTDAQTTTLTGFVFEPYEDGTVGPCAQCLVTFDELKVVTATASDTGAYSVSLTPGLWDIFVECEGSNDPVTSPQGALSVSEGVNERDIVAAPCFLLDSDGDYLVDDDEINVYYTDPLNPDTDDDGLDDYEEVVDYYTDPLNPDTDDDGYADGDEVYNLGTDPLVPDEPLTSGDLDADFDGLGDDEEVFTYFTDPTNPDTDFDGLTDYEEVFETFTDPLNPDTDRDGVLDGDE